MDQEIEITIDTDGKTDIDLINFKGKKCSEVMEALEKALGARAKIEQKPEYFQSDDGKVKEGIKGHRL